MTLLAAPADGRVFVVVDGRVRVRTPYGTEATGRIVVTPTRRGSGTERTRQAVLEDGSVTLTFGRLSAGRHRAVLRYRGDAHTGPCRLTRDARVRRGCP